eukprot:1157271-Pelagomonas_calceolata.AAC.18
MAPCNCWAVQVLEELLIQRAGKAVVKDALQSLVPPNPSTQLPQLAIPLKALSFHAGTGGIPSAKGHSGPGAISSGSSSGGVAQQSWCGMRQMEVLRQSVLACKLYDLVQVQLHSYGLMPALRDIEMPLMFDGSIHTLAHCCLAHD